MNQNHVHYERVVVNYIQQFIFLTLPPSPLNCNEKSNALIVLLSSQNTRVSFLLLPISYRVKSRLFLAANLPKR